VSVPTELFDEDYLYFYAEILGAARSDADAATVARLLGLGPGQRVLDVPCGPGRIAGRLAALGCEVVGIDDSELMLEVARSEFASVEFLALDMRALSYEDEFDAIVNWFTSFGYFEPAENDAVLRSFARALRPEGKLLIELLNADRLAAVLKLTGGTTAVVSEREGDLMADRITLPEPGRSRTERFIVRGGRVRRTEFSLEQIPPALLERRLLDAGFASVALYGAGGGEFDPAGARVIAVATR
jgi:SAM-dependent methyltransferase